jgi:hypothetical protein
MLLRREPFDEKENYDHYTNETLVQQESFWEDLLNKREV